MRVGYARVSTTHQELDAQLQALAGAGVDKRHIYHDVLRGVRDDRPQLQSCLKALRKGDTLVIPAFDRLGRSLPHLVKVATDLQARGVELVSLREAVDTTTAAGKLAFHVFGALAEFERELIRERTKAGLAAKKRQGVRLGAPRKLSEKEVKRARQSLRRGDMSAREVARQFGVSKATLFRYIPGGRSALQEPRG